MPGLDKYEEAWTAHQERFGRLDTVLSAGKKCIDQDHSERKWYADQTVSRNSF